MEIRGHALVQGASRGLGLEFARQLLSRPEVESVTATCRSPDGADGLHDLVDSSEKPLQILPMDVIDEASVRSAAERFETTDRELSVVLNVAGVLHGPNMRPERTYREVDPDVLSHSFRVNAFGPLLVAKHFARFLPRHTPAVWANLSARVGSIGDNRKGGWYAYRASKAAQNQFTRCLSIELSRRYPRLVVVALHPGTVDTGLSEPFQKSVPAEKLFTVARAATQLLDVISSLGPRDTGGFFAWDGKPIEW